MTLNADLILKEPNKFGLFFCMHIRNTMVYFWVAMANTKSKKSATKKSPNKTSKKKTASAVRDIKPSKEENTFTIREIEDDDVPVVEPLEDSFDESEESPFETQKVEMDIEYEPARPPKMEVHSVMEEKKEEPASVATMERFDEANARELIKVRFGTFVNLIANRDLEEVFTQNAEQQLIMNSNLLTELASSKDRREEKRIPIVFLVGIAIGVVLTYIFFST